MAFPMTTPQVPVYGMVSVVTYFLVHNPKSIQYLVMIFAFFSQMVSHLFTYLHIPFYVHFC